MPAFSDLRTITAGAFPDRFDFNLTTLCMKDFFDKEHRQSCLNIPGLWPSGKGAMLFFQGIPTKTYPIFTIGGHLLSNGTWTGALGELQSGIIDTFVTDAFITLERHSNGFQYTTPFVIDKYAALMLRHQSTFTIDMNSVTAGIGWLFYVLTAAFLFLTFVISLINERLQHEDDRNSIWHLLLSLSPMNGQMYPKQGGVTRRLLMTISGFGILVLSSLYQAKQAEELMVPNPLPVITLRDIEIAISTNRAKLLLAYEGSPVKSYIAAASEVLANSMKTNPPMYVWDGTSELEKITSENGIYIDSESTMFESLSVIESDMCANYQLIVFEEWSRMYSALILRKDSVALLEEMNRIVAERISHVDEFIQSTQIKEQCREHIFPVYTTQPRYVHLEFAKIGGAFAFLGIFLGVSFLVLLIEIVFKSRMESVHLEIVDTMIELHLYYDERIGVEQRDAILLLHARNVQLIEYDTLY